MLFLGHIGVSLLLADATKTDRAAAVAGNLVPDVVDKTGAWVLHAMPASRWIAHGLPCFSLACLVARTLLQPRHARAFALGYAGHLVCDLYAGGRVPWLAPFETPRRAREKHTVRFVLAYLAAEVVGGIVTWRLLRRPPTSSG